VRKIAQPLAAHNARARLAAVVALSVLALALAGCRETHSSAAASAPRAAHGCRLVVDTSGLAAFFAAAERLQAKPDTPAADVGAELEDQPVWNRWRRSFEPEVVPPTQLGRVLRAAVFGQESLTQIEAVKLVHRDAARCQAFTLAQRAPIQAFVDDFVAQEAACGVWPLARAWIRPEALPDTLYVDLLACNAEIRRFEGHHLLDAGLAYAGGSEQTVRLLASVLYRQLEATPGSAPGEVAGDAVLAETLRVIRNEGIGAYIDDLPELFFSREHPTLSGASPVPERLCETARSNLQMIESVGARQVGQAAGARDFSGIHLNLVGSRGWQATGWFMARVIARRLGEPRLQAASHAVSDFVASYQEAALADPVKSDAAPGTLDHYFDTAPAFSAPVFALMLEILGQAS
jgi:hypothetical protein